MRFAFVIALAGCGAAPPVPTPRSHVVAPTGDTSLRFRKLEAGVKRGHAVRTTFVLRDNELDETDETLAQSVSISDADRDSRWRVRATHHYRGTRRAVTGGFDLELTAGDDAQPLALHCVETSIAAEAPGAVFHVVPDQPDFPACEGHAGWTPDDKQTIEVVACSAVGQVAADADDDDRLVFARAPGVELVDENGDCGRHGGFRRLPR